MHNSGQNVWDTLYFRCRGCNSNSPPSPPLTVLGVTSQTPFTYLAHVEDLNFVHRGKVFSRPCL